MTTTISEYEQTLAAAGVSSVNVRRGRYGWTATAPAESALATAETLEGALLALVERVACWAPTTSMGGEGMMPTEGDEL